MRQAPHGVGGLRRVERRSFGYGADYRCSGAGRRRTVGATRSPFPRLRKTDNCRHRRAAPPTPSGASAHFPSAEAATRRLSPQKLRASSDTTTCSSSDVQTPAQTRTLAPALRRGHQNPSNRPSVRSGTGQRIFQSWAVAVPAAVPRYPGEGRGTGVSVASRLLPPEHP